MLLPKKVGSFTLMRRLDGGQNNEAYVAILDEPAGKQVLARRVAPGIAKDPTLRSVIEARVRDLMMVRHPTLVPVLDAIATDHDLWVLEEWTESVDLRAVVARAARENLTMPHNVFLNVATQICNGLEALHGRRAANSGEDNLLHLALNPSAVRVDADGRVQLGGFGLIRSPLPAAGPSSKNELGDLARYLSPEQTHADQRLSPASDIFSLGSLLYELLVLEPMFKADSDLQTVQLIRRAELSSQLLEVRESLPGLDKVLFRALSLNPRHRYQRAFVLREDLRGLMAGFTFADIEEVSRAFFGPVFVDNSRYDDDFGESAPTHVGPMPTAPEPPGPLETTFAPAFEDESPSPSAERAPPRRAPVASPTPVSRTPNRATPSGALPRARPAGPRTPRSATPRSAPQRGAPASTPRSAPTATGRSVTPPTARMATPPPRSGPSRSAPPPRRSTPPPRSAPQRRSVPPPSMSTAIDEDEEPTIGPGSLTVQQLHEQLDFPDQTERHPRLASEERRRFDDGVGEGGDAPTEQGSIVVGADGSFKVETRAGGPRPVEATLRRSSQRAPAGPVVRPEPVRSGPGRTGESTDDPDSWNPKADLDPQLDWGTRPVWAGAPGDDAQYVDDPDTAIGGPGQAAAEATSRSPDLGNVEFGEGFVDEDEVDTREHAAALWERQEPDESSDDPATAWKPGLSVEDSIRVFDDPTFDAGVDPGFDATFDGPAGAARDDDDQTVNLQAGAPELPMRDGAFDAPADLARSVPPLPPRDFGSPADADAQDRTMEARSPMSDLPPRMGRPPSAPSLPSFPLEGDLPAAPPPGRGAGGTLIPEDSAPIGLDAAPRGLGDRTVPEATAQLRGRLDPPAEPPHAPRGLGREDILRGRMVSDNYDDEDPEPQLSWRTVFAVVAVGGFTSALALVALAVYVASQPEVASMAQELVAGLVGASEPVQEFEIVEEFDEEPEAEVATAEAEPVEEEAEAEPEEEVEVSLAELRAEAVVRTEVDPSETFAAMEKLDPTPVPDPEPPPRPVVAPPPPAPVPDPEPVRTANVGGQGRSKEPVASRAIDPFVMDAPEPEPERRKPRRRDREPEPDPARKPFELPPPPPPQPLPGATIAREEMDRWSSSAFRGQLSPGSAERLESVEIDDPQFTRARTLLYLNAKKRGKVEEQRGHLKLLMSLKENQYNPVLLVEDAADAIGQKQYDEALSRAKVAEQHWARMPPSLVFTRKALIYEIEALAHTGQFFDSEGKDVNALRGAIRGWEKFQRHVAEKGRNDMVERAAQNLQRLRELEERLK